MAMLIRDSAELLKYLETRKEMTENTAKVGPKTAAPRAYANGAVYAFEEAIRAVEAFRVSEADEKNSQAAERSEAVERLSAHPDD